MIEKRAILQAPELRKDAGRRTVAGYASVFNVETDIAGEFVEKVAPGAFRASIDRQDIRALYSHDPARILGRKSRGTLRLDEDERGLRVEIDLPDTTDGRDVEALIARGDLDGMSFGFRTNMDLWDMTGDVPVRTLMDVELFEVSVVGDPAYPDTSVALRSLEKAKAELPANPKAHNFEAMKLRHRIKQDLAEKGRSKP